MIRRHGKLRRSSEIIPNVNLCDGELLAVEHMRVESNLTSNGCISHRESYRGDAVDEERNSR